MKQRGSCGSPGGGGGRETAAARVRSASFSLRQTLALASPGAFLLLLWAKLTVSSRSLPEHGARCKRGEAAPQGALRVRRAPLMPLCARRALRRRRCALPPAPLLLLATTSRHTAGATGFPFRGRRRGDPAAAPQRRG